jgi:hypothetical protein
MRRIVQDTLVSLDGVLDSPQKWGLADFQDDTFICGTDWDCCWRATRC